VCDLGDDIQRGEPWGEQGLARGVPPLLRPVQCQSRVMRSPLGPPEVCSNCNQRRDLLAERCGRRCLPPAPMRRHGQHGQWQYRGVSDREIWPDLRSRPRPRKWSLTPRCLCLSRSRRSPPCRSARSARARAICTVCSSAVALDCSVRDRALKALRGASPAHARG